METALAEFMNDDRKYFKPPFCPNSKCNLNLKKTSNSKHLGFIRKGSILRQDGSRNSRFLCTSCRKSFCESIFHLNYRLQKRGHVSSRIFDGALHNRSNRSIARALGVSEALVRHRIMRLSQAAILRHQEFVSKVRIREPIAYDGVEAFARSQYEPNNINQAIGSESLFCYFFNLAPMNRKGRMSEQQRKYLLRLEDVEGRFNPRAIRLASRDLFKELISHKSPQKTYVELRSDEHFQYKRAVTRDLKKDERAQIRHQTVSSKATRNYKNILFPVNHMDLLMRRKIAAFSRETICFAKKPSRMMQKYILYVCYKNYMKPQFVKPHKNDKLAHTHSPAMRLGLCARLLEFHDLFLSRNPSPDLRKLPLDWKYTYNDKEKFKRSIKFLKQKPATSNT